MAVVMKECLRLLCGFVIVLCNLGFVASASGAAYGQLHLYGTGIGPNALSDDGSQTFHHSLTASFISESAIIQSHAFNGFDSVFTSRGKMYANDGVLGAFVEGTGQGGWTDSPLAGGWADLTWYDSVTVQWGGPEPNPPPGGFATTSLHFHFIVEAELLCSPNGLEPARASFDFNPGTASWTSIGFRADPGQDIAFQSSLSGVLSLTNGFNTFQYGTRVYAVTPLGVTRSDAFNTMKLTSILLPDGTTPESHGYRLVFQSGMESPNLQNVAVPEPSALFAWSAFSSLGLIGIWRKWRG
jgi:hypothetical protein